MIFSENNITSIIIEGKEYNIQSISFIGTEAEWNTNSNYIPKAGELVIYTPDNDNNNKNKNYRFKIGDGTSKITDLVLNYIETTEERKGLLDLIENNTKRLESAAKNITDLTAAFEVSENNFNKALSGKADIIQHAEGEVITLDNAAYTPVKDLKLFGKTTQFTTIGKNLYKTDNAVQNADGTWTIVNNTSGDLAGPSMICTEKIPAGTYTFSVPSIYGSVYYKKASDDYSTQLTSGGKKTFEYDGESYLVFNFTNVPANTTAIYKIQLERGATATEFEPYTGGIPAPNPDYPQELVSHGNSGTINTMVCGKNLAKECVTASSKNTFEINGDSLHIYSLQEGTNQGVKYNKILLKKGVTYTASLNTTEYVSGICRFGFRYASNNSFVPNASKTGLSTLGFHTFTYTPKEDMLAYLSILITWNPEATMGDATFSNIQLEVGPSATEYEPAVGQTITTSTPNGLTGVPVASGGNYTDENGQQRIGDEVACEQGVRLRRAGELVMDGTKVKFTGKSASATKTYLYAITVGDLALPDYSESKVNAILCSHGASISHRDAFSGTVGATAYAGTVNALRFSFGLNEAFDTIEKANDWLANQYNNGTPLTFLYVRTEPIETPLTEEELAAYAALRTNKPNTTVYNDANAYMEMDYYTPTTAVQMVHSPADEGKVLSIDQHGCVVLTDLATRIARIESQLAYMAIITNNEEMLEV